MLICISRQLAVVLLLVGSKVKDSGVIQLMLQNAIQGKIFWWGEACIRKIKGFLKRLILLIRLKIIFKADKENKTRNLLKFF